MDVIRITGPARIVVVVFMICEVRAPVAVLHMMKLSLREVRDIPVVTELSCGLECSVGALTPNCQTGYIVPFYYRKSQQACAEDLEAFLWVPSLAFLELPQLPQSRGELANSCSESQEPVYLIIQGEFCIHFMFLIIGNFFPIEKCYMLICGRK